MVPDIPLVYSKLVKHAIYLFFLLELAIGAKWFLLFPWCIVNSFKTFMYLYSLLELEMRGVNGYAISLVYSELVRNLNAPVLLPRARY